MRLFLHWILSTVAIVVASYLVPGTRVTLVGAVIAAVVLGALNLFVRPVLLIFALPINLLTLGLFTLVVNALLILLVSAIVPGFVVGGFGAALLFALVLAVVHWVFHFWSR